jgi:hypothetical protein
MPLTPEEAAALGLPPMPDGPKQRISGADAKALGLPAVPPEATPSGPSPTKWSQKLGEGVVPGFNRIAAAVQAAGDPLIPGRVDEWGPDFATRYAEHLRAEQGQGSQTQREDPIPSALLQVAGSLPSAVLLGPTGAAPAVGRAASARFGATQGAGFGAMYGAGEARSETPLGVLAETGAGAVGGGLLGAGFGAAMPNMTPAPPRSVTAAAAGEPAPLPKVDPAGFTAWLRKYAGERNLKSAGAIQSDITRSRKQLGPGGANDGRAALTEMGAEMGEKGLVSSLSTPEKTFERSAALMEDAGGRMGQILSEADARGGATAPPKDGFTRFYHGGVSGAGKRWLTPDPRYAEGYAAKTPGATVQYVDLPNNHPALTKAFDDSGTNMKSPFSAFEADEGIAGQLRPVDGGQRPTLSGILGGANKILARLQSNPHTASGADPEHAAAGHSMGSAPADLFGGLVAKYQRIYGAEPLSFAQLHEIRMNISKDLYGMRGTKDPWADAYKDALHDLRGVVSKEIEAGLDAATSNSAAWKAANRDYQVASKALEFADKGMDRAVGNNQVTPYEMLSLLGGATGVGGATGNAYAGGLGGLATFAVTRFARRHGSGVQGAGALGLSNLLRTNPKAFGPYAERLAAAEAQRGPEGLAAAHYVLSVQDPAYAALVKRVQLAPSQAAAEGEE